MEQRRQQIADSGEEGFIVHGQSRTRLLPGDALWGTGPEGGAAADRVESVVKTLLPRLCRASSRCWGAQRGPTA